MAEEGKKQTSAVPPAASPTNQLYQDTYSQLTASKTRALDPADLEQAEAQVPQEPPPPPIDVEEELATAMAALRHNLLVFLEILGQLVSRLVDLITWPFRILVSALANLIQLLWMAIMMVLRPIGRILLFPFRPLLRLVRLYQDPLGQSYEKEAGEAVEETLEEVPVEEVPAPPSRARVTFLDLAEKGIVFVDDKKAPLYTLDKLRGKGGYTVNREIMDAAIIGRVLEQFKELAPRARALPPPQSGRFAGTPMPDILENATEDDVRDFIYYVNTFPKKYIGKELKFAGSFAAWVSAGAPLE